MESHLSEPFDLKRPAHAISMSEFHFSRLYKMATGILSRYTSYALE
jgi:transcriptional regulator GlxA family with amidase domain